MLELLLLYQQRRVMADEGGNHAGGGVTAVVTASSRTSAVMEKPSGETSANFVHRDGTTSPSRTASAAALLPPVEHDLRRCVGHARADAPCLLCA